MDIDIELSLRIDDDFKSVQFFDVDNDYPDAFDDFTNQVCVSVSDNDGTIAYMECTLFRDERINESIYDYVLLADDMVQDAYEAMELLKKCSLIPPSEKNRTLGETLTSFPTVTVYLRYIAVKDEYRGQGIGGWLLRNLPRILKRNYSVFPRLVIAVVCPQEIKWLNNSSKPHFDNLDVKSAEYKEMYKVMCGFFEKNEYERHSNTDFYIAHQNLL